MQNTTERIVEVSVRSGDLTARFDVPFQNLTSSKLEEEIRRAFVVDSVKGLSSLSYEDEEGDTISLNLGVAVEFQEALCVLGSNNNKKLQFSINEILPFQPIDKTHTVVGELKEFKKMKTKNNDSGDRQVQDHAEQDEALQHHKHLAAHTAQHQVAVQMALQDSQISCVGFDPDDDLGTSTVMANINAVLTKFTGKISSDVKILQKKLDTQKEVSMQTERQAEEAIQQLEVENNTLREKMTGVEKHCADLDEQILINESLFSTEKLSLEEELQKRSCDNQSLKQVNTDLTYKIASQVEELFHSGEEVTKLKSEMVIKNEEIANLTSANEKLQEQLDQVFARIACLLPDTKPKAGEKVKKAFVNAAETVGAVCVAAKEEISEIFQGTHNYDHSQSSSSASSASVSTTSLKVDDVPEVLSAQQRKARVRVRAKKQQVSTSPSLAPAPASFIQAMDSIAPAYKRPSSAVAKESASSSSSSSSSSSASASASHTDVSGSVSESSELEDAYCKICKMGLSVTKEAISEYMKRYDGNFIRVVNAVLEQL